MAGRSSTVLKSKINSQKQYSLRIYYKCLFYIHISPLKQELLYFHLFIFGNNDILHHIQCVTVENTESLAQHQVAD